MIHHYWLDNGAWAAIRPLLPKNQPGAVESGAGAAAAPGRRKRRTPKEIGGPAGPEPTRYGDWERKGIASDF